MLRGKRVCLSTEFRREHGEAPGARRSTRRAAASLAKARGGGKAATASPPDMVRRLVAMGGGEVVEESAHEQRPAEILLVSMKELTVLPGRSQTIQLSFETFAEWIVDYHASVCTKEENVMW